MSLTQPEVDRIISDVSDHADTMMRLVDTGAPVSEAEYRAHLLKILAAQTQVLAMMADVIAIKVLGES